MKAFFHVAWRAVYGQKDSEFMDVYRKLKFKMKLGYECWKRGCELQKLILDAIEKTLDESLALSTAKLQKFVKMDDGVPDQYGAAKSGMTPTSIQIQNEGNEEENRRLMLFQVAKHLQKVAYGMEYEDLQKFITIQKFRQQESFGLALVQFYEALTAKRRLEYVLLRKKNKVSLFDHLKGISTFIK